MKSWTLNALFGIVFWKNHHYQRVGMHAGGVILKLIRSWDGTAAVVGPGGPGTWPTTTDHSHTAIAIAPHISSSDALFGFWHSRLVALALAVDHQQPRQGQRVKGAPPSKQAHHGRSQMQMPKNLSEPFQCANEKRNQSRDS